MSLIKLMGRLSGLIRGGIRINSPASTIKINRKTERLSSDLPAGDRVAKKQNWISAKNKK